MKYICCYSGGKDSTASILLANRYNEPLDTIVFSEVFYCNKRGISGELPEHIKFIKETAKPMFEKMGYEFIILSAERDFLDCFNRRIEKPRSHMNHKGLSFGFPCASRCGIRRDCKIKPIKDYIRSIGEPVVEYVGIAADEEKRLQSMHKDPNKVSLLEKYGYDEQMAFDLCKEYGLISPSYDYSSRGGCWFCMYSKPEENLQVKRQYPEIWSEFVSLEDRDDLAYKKWNVYGTSLKERDKLLSSMMND